MGPLTGRRPAIMGLAVVSAALLAGCGGSGQTHQKSAGSGGAASSSSGYGGGYGASSSSSSSSSSTGTATSSSTVHLISTSKGKLLANARGFTLYLFTADHGNVDSCVKTSGCTSTWPPYTVSGKPTGGAGVNPSMLHTIKLPDGKQQVTYAGHPLYGYTGDSGPGATSYIGISSFGGTWYGVNASGNAVH